MKSVLHAVGVSRIAPWGLLLMATLLSVSCTSPGAFRDVPRKQPHAVFITGEIDYSIFTPTYETVVHTINGQPVDRADRRNRYRIPPGATAIQPGWEDDSTRYASMHFTAVAGRTYVLRPPIKGVWMELVEYLPGKKSRERRVLARSAPIRDFAPDDRSKKF